MRFGIRSAVFAVAAIAVAGSASAQIKINEIFNGSGNNEYIEFYNPTGAPVDVSGWTLVRRTNAAVVDATVYTFPGSTTIAAGGYYTIADAGVSFTPNGTYTNVISTGNQSIALKDAGAAVIDGVGVGTGTLGAGTLFYSEGTTFPAGIATGTGLHRLPNGTDTNDNSTNFVSYASSSFSTPGVTNDPPALDQVAVLPGTALNQVVVYFDKNMTNTGTYTVNPGAIVPSTVAASGNAVTLTLPSSLTAFPSQFTVSIAGATATDSATFTGTTDAFIPGTTTLAQIRGTVDGSGVSTIQGVALQAEAIVSEDFLDTFTDRNIYAVDGNKGIGLFDPFATSGAGMTTNFNDGDRVLARGIVGVFNGQNSIQPAADDVPFCSLLSSGNALPSPTVVAATDEDNFAGLEPLELSFVQFNNVDFFGVTDPGATFAPQISGSGVSYDISNQVGNAPKIVLRVDRDVANAASPDGFDNQPVPASAFSVVGLLGQFDSTSPFTGGYQILPLSYTALTVGSSVSDWHLSE